jgi:hypothetical protein
MLSAVLGWENRAVSTELSEPPGMPYHCFAFRGGVRSQRNSALPRLYPLPIIQSWVQRRRAIGDLVGVFELLDVFGNVRCFLSGQAHTWHLGMRLEEKEGQSLRVEARRACDSRKRRYVSACALLTRGDHVTG